MIKTAAMKLTMLRKAIRNNRVSFPSQVPLFVRNGPGNLQRCSVQLYFLRGWNCGKIARRYGYSRFYIWQIVNEWKRRAGSLGYLQLIPPAEALLDLRDAVQRTLDRATPLERGNSDACTDPSSPIAGHAAGPELRRPEAGWTRKAAAIRSTDAASPQTTKERR